MSDQMLSLLANIRTAKEEIERLRSSLEDSQSGSENLRADVKFWNETAIDYKRQLNETIRRGPESAGLVILTEADIDKAWKLANYWGRSRARRLFAQLVLERLHIVACPKCGGEGEIIIEHSPDEPCPACNRNGVSHGWKVVSDDPR